MVFLRGLSWDWLSSASLSMTDSGIECTLSECAEDTRLSDAVDTINCSKSEHS